MKKVNPIIQWWMTPKLPYQHIVLDLKGKNIVEILRLVVRKWLIHPVKRRMAKYYLTFLRKFTDIKVIGITGSAGKTTTKEMIASILKLEGKTVYSVDNIDPVYNIPTTILRCNLKTKYLVLEMGVEFPGEMDFYLWLAKPDLGVITNIFPTHTEFFGDRGGVLKEKSKLASGIQRAGTVILNKNDKLLEKLGKSLKKKIIWFGDGGEVMSSSEKIENHKTAFLLIFNLDEQKKAEVTLSVTGKQFIENALAASAVAKSLGLTLGEAKKGLEVFKGAEHRMEAIKTKTGAIILDDSYNNNPQAAIEALNTLSEFAGNKDKIVVFGDMLELGKLSQKYHKKLGEYLGKVNLIKLICVGELSHLTAEVAAKSLGKSYVVNVNNQAEARHELKHYLNKDVVILVKGSRSMHLDELVRELTK